MRRAWRVCAAGAAGLASAVAAARQPAAEPSDLAAAERRAADRSLPLRERELAADRALELRKWIISAAPAGDARLPGLLLDQAAGTLAVLGRDGADTAALFGVALPAQRAAVLAAAGGANTMLDRAAKQLAESAAALAASGVPAEDPRMSAIDQERSVRVPFYRARAAALLAACAGGAQLTAHAQAAIDAVGKLPLASPGPEAARRVNYAAALLLRGGASDAQAAADELGTVVKSLGAEAGVAPITRAEAWLGLVHAGIAMGRIDPSLEALRLALAREPFVPEGGRPDTLLTVLAADAATRALFERAIATKDAALLPRAVAQQTALLARTDLSLRPESLRPLAFEKLALLAETVGELPLPAAARLGQAIVLARDPARRVEAMAAFQAVADLPDAGPYAADALWEWAVMLTQTPAADRPSRLRAAQVLTRLAREFPDHPQAAGAVGAALAHARALVLEPSPADQDAAAAAYVDVLALATASYPQLPEIDLWRYERARLLSQRPAGAAPAPEADLDAALDELAKIPASSPLAPDADRLTERVAATLLDGLRSRATELRRAGEEAGVRMLARERIVPAARRAAEWARDRSAALRTRFGLDLADAMTDAGDAAGRPLYEAALKEQPQGWETRIRLGLARAKILAGDSAGAFPLLREVATRLDGTPEKAGAPVRPDEFWQAWTLMLELLAEQNGDGSRSGTMRANIKRLEGIDPDLGGPPWRERIAKVRGGLGPE